MISRAQARTQPPRLATQASSTAATTSAPTRTQVYGESFFAAEDLGASVRRLTQLLGQPPLTNAFGARDQWAVVDEAAKPPTSKKPASARDER